MLARTHTRALILSFGVYEQFKDYVRHEYDSFGLQTKCTEIKTATVTYGQMNVELLHYNPHRYEMLAEILYLETSIEMLMKLK